MTETHKTTSDYRTEPYHCPLLEVQQCDVGTKLTADSNPNNTRTHRHTYTHTHTESHSQHARPTEPHCNRPEPAPVGHG